MTRHDLVNLARQVGWPTSRHYFYGFDLEKFVALFEEATRADERKACISIIEDHRIPVGNSAAGELAGEWTYEALKEIRDGIRSRGSRYEPLHNEGSEP